MNKVSMDMLRKKAHMVGEMVHANVEIDHYPCIGYKIHIMGCTKSPFGTKATLWDWLDAFAEGVRAAKEA